MWRLFITITAAYPIPKASEVWLAYRPLVDAPATYRFLKHCATASKADVRAGLLTYTMFVVANGQGGSALNAVNEIMKGFHGIEGFRYSVDHGHPSMGHRQLVPTGTAGCMLLSEGLYLCHHWHSVWNALIGDVQYSNQKWV